MAKRKRLTPPIAAYVDSADAPETKSAFPRRPGPIADVARDSSAVAALEEMSQTWATAREDGLLVIALPHDTVLLDHLHRDRISLNEDDANALKQSLFERGQQTPIEVVHLPNADMYGLLSGWRRCQMLRALYAETGEARFATVQALIRRPEDVGAAYRTMVEENEIRANLSHYERARIVVKAVEAGVFETEKEALSALYGAVPRARRSKIRSFLAVVHTLDGVLQFPEAISERVGLSLSHKLRADARLAGCLRDALASISPASSEDEQAELLRIMDGGHSTLNMTGSLKNQNVPATTAASVAKFPGLAVRRGAGGSLVLSGSALNEDVQADLITWLQQRLNA
jgi:ParB family chromosome partitioning protein